MKLTVVGAGLAGSWLTRVARAQGWEAELVSAGEPTATQAAIALLRPSHLPVEDRPLLNPSIQAHEEAGVEVLRGADFTRWDRSDSRHQTDWIAVDPTTACLQPDTFDVMTEAAREGVTVFCTGSGEGRITYGSTLYHPDPDALVPQFAVHMLAPYKVVAGVRFDSGARIGSSSAATPAKAREQRYKFARIARELGWLRDTEGWQVLDGVRIQRSPRLTRNPDGSWSWYGFHRTGFGIVPAEAEWVLGQIS